MASALFDINSDGDDQGYEATHLEVLTLRLRQQPPIGVTTVQWQVFDPNGFDPEQGIAANPPRSSKGAPTLTLVGATSGQLVSPATVDGTVTITMPASGSHSWIVRCIVNGGVRTLPNGVTVADPTLIHERGVYIVTSFLTRKVVCTELRQFEDDGWAGALADLPDLIIPDHSIALVKLPSAASAPSVIGASVNGTLIEMPKATLSGHLRGVGLTVDSGGSLRTRHRPRRIQEFDYFVSGTNVSGSIGKLGWTLTGTGTPSVSRLSAANLNTSSKLAIDTSAAANNRSVLCLGENEAFDVVATPDLVTLQCAWNMNNDLTNMRVFFGLQESFATDPTAEAECIGILYDSSVSPNYQILSRVSSTGTPTVTSQVVPANTSELITIHQPSSNVFNFYVGNTLIGTINSGTPATANGMNVGWRVETLAASIASIRVGYFGINGDLLGALDDDAFLEA
jgi:hypothetical protein